METSEVRRRLRAVLEQARKDAQERRARADTAEKEYAAFLEQRAIPTFHTVASVLGGEGHRFRVSTPARSVRLAAENTASTDFIELELDTTADPPVVIGRTNHGRGRRQESRERPIRLGAPIGVLNEEDVLEFLLEEISTFVAR